MTLILRQIAVLFLIILYFPSLAQQKDSTWIGSANGVVRDSVHNYELPSATLAIYILKDSSLVSYQLSDNFGEFHFNGLPTNTPLRITVSYIGYKSVSGVFVINKKDKSIDLKSLNLEKGLNILQGVVITAPPPVQMNGDTLEFNADAFRLDPNAQTEDLLRVLPGVTIWGDGTITVNGKAVHSVLVDGKPFFGGDAKIATQNIPKNAVDKIQVYQQNQNKNNPLDSLTEINVKLKESKRFGHFGKIAAGYGTADHYEADANLSFFSPQTQLGFVGASNNINKVANDVRTLMRNSTFKGVGASIDYQPDFSTQGINQPNAGGFTFQHEFSASPEYFKTNRLNADYFIKNINNNISSNVQTITSLGGHDSSLVQEAHGLSGSNSTGQDFSAKYDRIRRQYSFYANSSFNSSNTHSRNSNQTSTFNAENILQSNNNAENENNDHSRRITFNTGINHTKKRLNTDKSPGDYQIDYSFQANNYSDNQINKTEFTSITEPAQNKLFDRHYNRNSNDVLQKLNARIGDFSPYLFRYRGVLSKISLQLQNNLEVYTHHEVNNVTGKDTVKNNYVPDPRLSNSDKLLNINEKPALNIGRTINKGLINRYNKIILINAGAQAQLFYQKNTSDHSFRDINNTYKKFIPNAYISYLNDQYGDFKDNYRLNFTTSYDYPTVQQLAPIVDSLNLYDITTGNSQLQPAEKRELSFGMQHASQQSSNIFSYNIYISGGIINNSFADSRITDSLGRSTHYTINADNNRYLNMNGDINKAIKLNTHQLQISLSAAFNISRVPNQINNIWNQSNHQRASSNLNLYYYFKDRLAVNLMQGLSYYRSLQDGINSSNFRNSTTSTAASASFNCTRKLTVGSNITYNCNTSSGSRPINFTIWNANANYRFNKNNTWELKLSALDMLHQNTSIINSGNNNTITRGTVNVLQQYFMFTFAYYPRQFGKKREGNNSLSSFL